MECSVATNLLSGLIGAIVGGLISAFATMKSIKTSANLSMKNSIDVLKIQNFLGNASDFISAFTDIVDFLESDVPNTSPTKFHSRFERSLGKISEAVIIFRVYLPTHQRIAFNTAWQSYRSFRYVIQKQQGEKEYNETELKKTIQTHIDNLLKFTEYEYVIKGKYEK